MREFRNTAAYLQSADQSKMNLFLEERTAFIIVARPAPHVFAIAVCLAGLQNGCSDDPHDRTKNEEAYGKDRVVYSGLLSPPVPTLVVSPEDSDRHGQGSASYAE